MDNYLYPTDPNEFPIFETPINQQVEVAQTPISNSSFYGFQQPPPQFHTEQNHVSFTLDQISNVHHEITSSLSSMKLSQKQAISEKNSNLVSVIGKKQEEYLQQIETHLKTLEKIESEVLLSPTDIDRCYVLKQGFKLAQIQISLLQYELVQFVRDSPLDPSK